MRHVALTMLEGKIKQSLVFDVQCHTLAFHYPSFLIGFTGDCVMNSLGNGGSFI